MGMDRLKPGPVMEPLLMTGPVGVFFNVQNILIPVPAGGQLLPWHIKSPPIVKLGNTHCQTATCPQAMGWFGPLLGR